jgi:hypothetical protein
LLTKTERDPATDESYLQFQESVVLSLVSSFVSS